MNITYKRDGNQSFMYPEGLKICDDYRMRMITNNNIDGIVPVKVKSVDNESRVYYCTTSMNSMESIYSGRKMAAEDIFQLVKDIRNLSEKMREYLLDINQISFEPHMIFKRQDKYYFCYVPTEGGSFQNNLRELFERILEYIDYKDKNAVRMAYGIQQISISDSFTVSDLMECAEKNNNQEKSAETLEEERGGEGGFKECYDKKVFRAEHTTGKSHKPPKGLWGKLISIFKSKAAYMDEEQLAEGANDMSGGLTDYKVQADMEDENDEDYDEGDTMLLTSAGPISSVTLRCIREDEHVEITPIVFPFIIGKSRKSSNFCIDSPVVSRVHARIIENMAGFFIEDLNSTNGTYVNSERIEPHKPIEIHPGDLVMFANMEFVVE